MENAPTKRKLSGAAVKMAEAKKARLAQEAAAAAAAQEAAAAMVPAVVQATVQPAAPLDIAKHVEKIRKMKELPLTSTDPLFDPWPTEKAVSVISKLDSEDTNLRQNVTENTFLVLKNILQ